MPQGPCPSCRGVFEFPVGFAEVYECPYCGANVVVPKKLVLNANLSSQQILIQGIICFIFATLLFFVPFMIFGSAPQSDLDWYIFFIICSWPTYILLETSIYFLSLDIISNMKKCLDCKSLFFRSNFVVVMVWKVFGVPCNDFLGK